MARPARLVVLCVILLASLVVAAPAGAASVTAVRSGPWGAASTWGGRVPGPADTVTIGAGRTVTAPRRGRAASVTVRAGGTLAFAGSGRARLDVSRGMTVGGTLRIRSPRGLRQRIVLGSGAGLEVAGRGRLDIAGTPKTAWTRTSRAGAARGARSLTLERSPLGWRRGDHLIVVPSVPPTTAGFSTGFDEVRIRAVRGNRVALDRPLAHAHPATGPGRNLRPEVLNLTRSVVIGGRPGANAHVRITARRPQRIKDARFRWSGVGGQEGKYGLHFHRAGNGARGSRVTGTVVSEGGNHAFVTHATSGVTYRHTISYDTRGDAYWWDPDRTMSNGNRYDWTVAARVRLPQGEPEFRGFRNSGYRLMQGNGNHLTNSVAVGVRGTTDASGFHWPEEIGDPHSVWGFAGNVSHNNQTDGIFNWQNDDLAHRLVNTTLYHNGGYGLDHGAYVNQYHFRGLTSWGNREGGIQLRAGSHDHALRFWDVLVHGAGISRHGIFAADHVLAAGGGGPTRMATTRVTGARGAQVRMAVGEHANPYRLTMSRSSIGTFAVTGAQNRLVVNGRNLRGSGRAAAGPRLNQPGAAPLTLVPRR